MAVSQTPAVNRVQLPTEWVRGSSFEFTIYTTINVARPSTSDIVLIGITGAAVSSVAGSGSEFVVTVNVPQERRSVLNLWMSCGVLTSTSGVSGPIMGQHLGVVNIDTPVFPTLSLTSTINPNDPADITIGLNYSEAINSLQLRDIDVEWDDDNGYQGEVSLTGNQPGSSFTLDCVAPSNSSGRLIVRISPNTVNSQATGNFGPVEERSIRVSYNTGPSLIEPFAIIRTIGGIVRAGQNARVLVDFNVAITPVTNIEACFDFSGIVSELTQAIPNFTYAGTPNSDTAPTSGQRNLDYDGVSEGRYFKLVFPADTIPEGTVGILVVNFLRETVRGPV